MPDWEDFESDCVNYLKTKFGKFAEFIHEGGSNSKVADIFVKTKSNKKFYIDVKQSPAQCGQFVLLQDDVNEQFTYSPRNDSKENEYSKRIKDFMNAHFSDFADAGTKGSSLDAIPDDVFTSWIIDHYKNLGCKYIITNNYKILNIDNFRSFFNVSATYRVKRSGSQVVSQQNWYTVRKYLMQNFKIKPNDIEDYNFSVKSNSHLAKEKFEVNGNRYTFSEKPFGLEIRKLSNTANANVIFTVRLKENCGDGISDNDFIKYLAN